MKQIEDGSGQPSAGQVLRGGFGATELQTQAETAAVAVAAQAKAAIEARYILALRQKRDWMEVRSRLIKESQRPGFAQSGIYQKPIGRDQSKWPTGPSIRFAEAALRCMTNVFPETMVVYESDDKRIIQVSVTDLEANLTYASQVVIQKTVERRNPNSAEVISERKNSYGDTVYVVRATEDDLLNKQNALISKALRTMALRLLPGDIMDECMEIMLETRQADIKADPDAAKKKLVDAFDAIGISPTDLAAWLKHSLDRIQPAELNDLRSIYSAIRDGEATWDAVMDARGGGGDAEMHQEMREAKAADAQAKLARMKAEEKAAALGVGLKGKSPAPPVEMTEAEMNALTAQTDAQQAQPEAETLPHTPEATGKPAPKFTFGGKK